MSNDSETTLKAKLPLTAWLTIAGVFASVVAGYVNLRSDINSNGRRIQIVELTRERDADIQRNDNAQRSQVDKKISDLLSRLDERTRFMAEQMADLKRQGEKK